MLGSTILIFAVNHYRSAQTASILFLALFTIILVLSDEPAQIVNGRSTFLFTVPIIMASFILSPWASFLMAGVSSLLIASLDIFVLDSTPGVPTMLGFFAVALVSWLASRSLEATLQELRVLNRDLELRVEERTRELEEANQQLEEANAHLRELDRLKSLFVAMVSHELRTPLTSIQGFTQMLLVSIYGALTNEQQSAVERVLANTKRLIKIVNDLLDKTRIEAGQLALHPTSFSPVELIDDVHTSMKMLAKQRGLELTSEVAPELAATLYGDQGRLHQILVNLVNNGLKFTDKGQVNIRAYRFDGAHWAMEVRDTGIGIPVKSQESIFEAFRQVDASVTRRRKGVGLGLSISRQLIELMGGRIIVASEINEGSKFTAIIPFTAPH
ncbi:MAG: hypothetical protein K8R89_09760 [Anaerolineae bacterium]|nr:hypothetical protein [Anaerolineae bacterium]